MTIYRMLYARGTAAALVIASWIILATAQIAVVVGAMETLHPSWAFVMQVLTAVGYELATLAVGLVIAVRAGEGGGRAPMLAGGLAARASTSLLPGPWHPLLPTYRHHWTGSRHDEPD